MEIFVSGKTTKCLVKRFMRKPVLLSFLIYLLSILPFWVLYRLSDLLFFLLYYVFRYRRRVVSDNLLRVFPEKTAKERRRIAFKYYRFLPDIMVESIKMRSISANAVKRRMRFINEEEVTGYLSQGKSVIGVTAHYGNWELGIHRLCLMTKKPVLIIYKPLTNKSFQEVYNNIRSRFGAIMVPMKQTLRKIVGMRHQAHVSMFVADQTPRRKDAYTSLDFLGSRTAVYNGVERIAKMTGHPVVFCHIDRVKRGHYTCEFTTIVADPVSETAEDEITIAHTRFTESIIRNKPELWLWSHKRWKWEPTAYGKS